MHDEFVGARILIVNPARLALLPFVIAVKEMGDAAVCAISGTRFMLCFFSSKMVNSVEFGCCHDPWESARCKHMICGSPKIAIRVSNWIGDLVMSLPALESIRKAFPEAEIVAITRPFLADLVRYQKGLVDRVIFLRDRDSDFGWITFLKFCNQLRREKFDRSFVLTRHAKGALMMMVAGIPNRIGFSVLKRTFRIGKRQGVNRQNERHDSYRYLDLLRRNSLEIPMNYQGPQLMPDHAAEKDVAEKFLSGGDGPFLVLHAGAAYGTAKRWIPERFAQVGRRFTDHFGGLVVLLGVDSEVQVNREIEEKIDSPSVINLCGRTSLAQSLSIISQCQVFLSNDSGLMHVAAAFSRPQVAIFGPTDVSTTYPHNQTAIMLDKNVSCSPCFKRHCPIDHRCMTRIETDEVWSAVRRLMEDQISGQDVAR